MAILNYFFSRIIVSQSMNQIEKRIFYAILAIAFVLRFFNFWNLPFTNDELSTLNRLNYSSYSDLVKYAIWTDGHPAGVQSFLWFYTKLLGTHPIVVKFPFLILSFISLPLFFFAAKNLTNTRTALFTLAFLATLQFPLFCSQTIRPYSSGQFLAALTIFLWSKHFPISTIKFNFKNNIPLAIAICLSLSNHYFNGFLAFYLLPIGILLNRRNLNFNYLAPWILGLLFYIPQFSIFLHQLKVGSPGWLQTPNVQTIVEHLKYCFHFSSIYILLFACIIAFRVFVSKEKSPIHSRAFIWFICYATPILTAFLYSIFRAPIFQDSIFVFSFFFLFLFLGDILLTNQMSVKSTTIILSAIILVNLYTLIIKREHFKQYFHHGYAQLVSDVIKLKTHKNTPVEVFGFEPFFFQYYSNRSDLKNDQTISFHRDVFFADSAKTAESFIRNFRNFNDSQLIIANAIEIPLWCISLLEKHYPYSIRSMHFGSEVYLFSKTNSILPPDFKKSPQNHYSIDEGNVPQKLKTITIHHRNSLFHYPYQSTEQYLETYSNNMQSFALDEYVLKHATMHIESKIGIQKETKIDLSKIKIILSVKNDKEEPVYYIAQDFNLYYDSSKFDQTAYLACSFNHFKFNKENIFTIFIDNELRQPIQVLSPLKITIKSGNRNIYSLTNDF